MKKLVKTTTVASNALTRLKLERLTGESITDKGMTSLSTDVITGVTAMHIYEVDTPDGNIQQAIIEDASGVHSTCSSVAITLIDELIELVNNGDVKLDEITLKVTLAVSQEGKKYLNLLIA